MSGHKYGDMGTLRNPYGIMWPGVATAGYGISAAGVSAAAAADRTGQNALFRCDHRTLVAAVGDINGPCGDGVLSPDERACNFIAVPLETTKFQLDNITTVLSRYYCCLCPRGCPECCN